MSSVGSRRRSKVLLGVTGSVAAVKGPQLVTQIVRQLNCDVQLILTHAGETFWNQAKEYNAEAWDAFRQLNDAEPAADKASLVDLHGMFSSPEPTFYNTGPFTYNSNHYRHQVGMARMEADRRSRTTYRSTGLGGYSGYCTT